jgi:hypothetical protein
MRDPFVNWQQKGLIFIRLVDYMGQAIGLNKKHLFAKFLLTWMMP